MGYESSKNMAGKNRNYDTHRTFVPNKRPDRLISIGNRSDHQLLKENIKPGELTPRQENILFLKELHRKQRRLKRTINKKYLPIIEEIASKENISYDERDIIQHAQRRNIELPKNVINLILILLTISLIASMVACASSNTVGTTETAPAITQTTQEQVVAPEKPTDQPIEPVAAPATSEPIKPVAAPAAETAVPEPTDIPVEADIQDQPGAEENTKEPIQEAGPTAAPEPNTTDAPDAEQTTKESDEVEETGFVFTKEQLTFKGYENQTKTLGEFEQTPDGYVIVSGLVSRIIEYDEQLLIEYGPEDNKDMVGYPGLAEVETLRTNPDGSTEIVKILVPLSTVDYNPDPEDISNDQGNTKITFGSRAFFIGFTQENAKRMNLEATLREINDHFKSLNPKDNSTFGVGSKVELLVQTNTNTLLDSAINEEESVLSASATLPVFYGFTDLGMPTYLNYVSGNTQTPPNLFDYATILNPDLLTSKETEELSRLIIPISVNFVPGGMSLK